MPVALGVETESDPYRPVNAYAGFDAMGDYTPTIVSAGDRLLAGWFPSNTFCNPMIATSDNGGITWSEPAQLKSNIGLDDGADGGPSIATDGDGTWVAIWRSDDTLGGILDSTWDILFSRSVDDGETWSPPQLLSEPTSAFCSTNDLATDGSGTWVAVFSGAGLRLARSTDNGETWSVPHQVPGAVQGYSPRLATDGAGTWIIVWYAFLDLPAANNDSDVLYIRSLDNGETWSQIRAVNTNAFGPNQTDSHPEIAVDEGGNWIVAWTAYDAFDMYGSDLDLLYARSTDRGATWSDPLVLNSDAADDGFVDHDDQVTLRPDSNDQWLASWRARRSGSLDIYLARSSDGGLTWSQVEPQGVSGSHYGPEIVPREAGNWLLGFSSTFDPDGSIGTDQDILATRLRVPFDETCAADGDADGYAATGDPACPLGAAADCDDTDIRIAPGAVDSCDGLNNDCSHPAWPSLVNTNESDDDGDGLSECEGDCDDGDATSWSMPALVSGVTLGRNGPVAEIAWEEPSETGGDAATVVYDVIRSEAPFACGLIGPQVCIEADDGNDRFATDSLVPEPGAIFFYQVRAENGCGGVGRLEFAIPNRPRVAIECH
jgi:hypothetical protein